MTRVAIVGSRQLPRGRARAIIFAGVASTPADTVIVSGAARGPRNPRSDTVSADREAARAAMFYRRELDELPADWDAAGRPGLDRNKRLVDTLTGPDDRLVAVWDGASTGTAHVVGYAKRVGKRVRVIVVRAQT